MGSRIPHVLAAVAVAATAFQLGSLSPARGAGTVDDVTCTVSNKWTATPPLTAQARQTHFTSDGTYSGCKGGDATLHSGTSHVEHDGMASCNEHHTRAGQKTVKWDNGQASVVSFQHTVNDTSGSGTIDNEGTVASGEFAGRSFSQQMTEKASCPAAGVSGGSGTGTLRIYH